MTRRTQAVVGACIAVLLAAWFLLLWSPKGKELNSARAAKASAESQVQELQVRVARLKSMQAQAPELAAENDKVKAGVPDQAELDQIILALNDAAAQAGVAFVSITPLPPAASKQPGVTSDIGLSIAVKGNYQPVLDFLDRLAELPRVIVVDGFTLLPGDSAAGSTLSVSLTGRAFTTQPAGGITPAATTAPSAVGSTSGTSAPTTTSTPTTAPGAGR